MAPNSLSLILINLSVILKLIPCSKILKNRREMKNRNRMEIISYRLPTVETWNCFASWKERQDHPFPIWFRDVGVRQTMMNLPMKAMDHHLLFCAKKRPATGHLVPIDHQSSNRPCYYLTSYHSGFHLLNQSIELN